MERVLLQQLDLKNTMKSYISLEESYIDNSCYMYTYIGIYTTRKA